MKLSNGWRTLLVYLALFTLFPGGCSAQVKEPAVAGSFYPADKGALSESVDRYLAAVTPVKAEGRLLAIVVPHAGHLFSGPVAAHAYAQLKGKDIRTVILIGPSHYARFNGAAIYPDGGMRTPLGTVPVNASLARSLFSEKDGVAANPQAFSKEHSLEVQLPFLQRTLKDFTVVPILIGNPTPASYRFLSEALSKILQSDGKALLVISTDLSHYHDAETAGRLDRKAVDAVVRLDGNGLERLLSGRECEMCGGEPVLFGMAAARGAGATSGLLYRYADSGDVTGDKSSVVGYAAIGLYRSGLTPAARGELLSLARQTVANHVKGLPLPEWRGSDSMLRADGAAFVTLKDKSGRLRGCIGTIQPVMPLHQAVIRNAVAASSKDFRFPPVRPEELPNLDVEVTVLSPLEPLSSISDITVGTHGLYLVAGQQSSVFLPQVPTEQGWNRDTYLQELALKAGLQADAWKRAKLYRFTAEIIH